MNWTDTAKATGLAALAERTTTVARIFDTAPSGWTRHDAWLTRVKPRTLVTDPSMHSPSTLRHVGAALRD
jgi:hypothetical protein